MNNHRSKEQNPLLVMPSMDRLSLFMLFALALHALIIFGIVFKLGFDSPPPPAKTLAITLVNTKSDSKNPDADFFAQSNQIGSGEKIQKATHTNTQQAFFPADKAQAVSIQEGKIALTTNPLDDRRLITTKKSSRELFKNPSPSVDIQEIEDAMPQASTQHHNNEVASLTTQIELPMQAEAKQLRHRSISAATREARDAEYLERWRTRIEMIGNLHYPDEARRQHLDGELRLLVAINADGSLRSIQIRQSSGQKVLDDAAINIVKLAAPFEPLSHEMRRDTDVLEIIRTWQFGDASRLLALNQHSPLITTQ